MGLEDVSKYANLFSSLYGSGNWTLLDLKKLAGLNFLRVWREVEKVKYFIASKSVSFIGPQNSTAPTFSIDHLGEQGAGRRCQRGANTW